MVARGVIKHRQREDHVMTDNRPLLRAQQVAERLNITPRHVYRLVEVGDLPAVRIGMKAVRIHPEDLDTYISDKRKAHLGVAG